MLLPSINSTIRALGISLLLVFALSLKAVPLRAESPTETTRNRTMGKHVSLQGVQNFGVVTPRLYRGGQPTHQGFERLARMGINIVVDTGRSRRDEKQIRQLGMRYVSIPWYCPFPNDTVFARFLKVMKENPGKKVFVHCRLGDDRTGMMVAAYRMADQGWTADEAMKEMHSFGFSAPHHVICPGLAHYEHSFPERFRTSTAFQALR